MRRVKSMEWRVAAARRPRLMVSMEERRGARSGTKELARLRMAVTFRRALAVWLRLIQPEAAREGSVQSWVFWARMLERGVGSAARR